jgi:hypothetical protein
MRTRHMWNQARRLPVDLGEVAGRVGRGGAAHKKKFNQCSEKLHTRHLWYNARHLSVDLGEVGGVGHGEAGHKFNQCGE